MARVGVTGANGFVGRATLAVLRAKGHEPVALLRRAVTLEDVEARAIGDVAQFDAPDTLRGLDAIIHLAARVHQMDEDQATTDAAHARTNVEGTRRLAEAAAHAGVRRFVYGSSIKAMAEREPVGADGAAQPVRPSDVPAPEDAYGRSKLAAERALWAVAEASGLDGVVVRPPLVHGPGAKGNLARLMTAVSRGWPLPLAGIDNARSLVSVRNLADLLALCAVDPRAIGGTWLVSDGPAVSTAMLVRTIAAAMDRPARLVRVPAFAMRLAGTLDRKGRVARLTESFQLDDGETRERLGWRPPQSFAEGIAEMVAARHGDRTERS